MSRILKLILEEVPMSISIPCIVICILSVASYFYTRIARGKFNFSLYMKIPGPNPLPIIGNALDFSGPLEQMIPVLRDKYVHPFGPITRFLLAHRPYVILTKAEGFETMMSSSKHIYKGPDYSMMHSWLGTGLLTSNGAKWHGRRKLLTPTFHFKILEDFLVVMNEQAQILVSKLAENDPNQCIDIFPYITHSALDIICESAMGRNVGAQIQSDSPYVRAVSSASKILMKRMLEPWHWSDFTFWFSPKSQEYKKSLEILHKFTDEVIRGRRAELEEEKKYGVLDMKSNKKKRLAFLGYPYHTAHQFIATCLSDLLLETKTSSGDYLTDADIREEVDTFMFEGHDTTASNLSFSIHLLASHPDIQKKVQDELDEIFGDDLERDATIQDLNKMKYLDSCIKESLRLYPSVPMISRQLTEDVTIENANVPKGTIVSLFIYFLHRDPKHFPNPEKFDPERFSLENTQKLHPYAYVPFSAGPRNCIGQKFAQMELKTIIASILRRFDVRTDMKTSDLTILPQLILRPKTEIPVSLQPRKA